MLPQKLPVWGWTQHQTALGNPAQSLELSLFYLSKAECYLKATVKIIYVIAVGVEKIVLYLSQEH